MAIFGSYIGKAFSNGEAIHVITLDTLVAFLAELLFSCMLRL